MSFLALSAYVCLYINNVLSTYKNNKRNVTANLVSYYIYKN